MRDLIERNKFWLKRVLPHEFIRRQMGKFSFWTRKLFPQRFQGPPPILFPLDSKGKTVQASHSGNIGDVIFSCLFLKAYWEHTGKKISLHLQIDVPAKYSVEHPLKNVRLNEKMAKQLVPVLSAQPYIAEVTMGPQSPNNLILSLDKFRELPLSTRCGIIPGWYQLCTDLWLDVFSPWITASRLPEYKDTIVISRTARLRSAYIDYTFLQEFSKDLLFIGIEEECVRFKAETGIACRYMTVESLDQMVNIIHSCRLFVGNQGFAYTVAESVKCPRVLEANAAAPNNYPLSPNGRIALFQIQFETFVRGMLASGA